MNTHVSLQSDDFSLSTEHFRTFAETFFYLFQKSGGLETWNM